MMIKTKMKINGMMCEMCESHICDVIRKTFPDAQKISASHKKGEASFLTEEYADERRIKEAIDAAGYTCTAIVCGPYKKDELFG